MAKNFAEDYVDVATRLVEFREKHPEGSLQPANPSEPLKVITIGEQTFILYTAAAYRAPDDPRPGIGIAWEPFPGKTPFTKDSEAMVCETSAWGRALIAVGAADAKRGIASANEVRNRHQSEPEPVDTSKLEELIVTAQDLGLDLDWDKSRSYAAQSQAHADKAVELMKAKMAEAEGVTA